MRIAEFCAHDLLHLGNAGLDLRLERFGISALVRVIVSADISRDGKSGRHREPDAGHFGQIGAFSAQKRLHGPISIGLFIAEKIDVLISFC